MRQSIWAQVKWRRLHKGIDRQLSFLGAFLARGFYLHIISVSVCAAMGSMRTYICVFIYLHIDMYIEAHVYLLRRSEVLRWMSDEVRRSSEGGLSPTDIVQKAKLHFGSSAFKESDLKSLLAFGIAVPPKLVDMLQALHFALVSPAQMRLPAKVFASIAELPREFPYAKACQSP